MQHDRAPAAVRFKRLLEETARLQRERVDQPGLEPAEELIATWQSQRLAATYADYRDHKRYRAAIEFFLSDLYGPHDFSQRDRDIERVYPIMVRTLTAAAIDSLAEAVALHTLSIKLDRDLRVMLVDRMGLDVTAGVAALTPEMYAEAYRRCDNYDARVEQIQLAVGAGELLEEAVKSKMIYATVKLARGPARLAGFGELQSFIERGLSAFKKMRGSHRFVEALSQREVVILDAIFDGAAPSAWYGEATHHLLPA